MLWSIAAVVALIAVGALTWYMRTARQAQTAPPRISRMTIASSGTAALGITRRSQPGDHARRHASHLRRSNNQLFVRPLDQLDARAILTGAAPLNWVFVSPDGQWVGFAEARTLKKVALTGGPAVTIVQTDLTIGATWAPDDTIIFATSDPATGLQRVSAGGGDVTVLTRPDQARGELDHLWPEMLPGGRAVLFTITATTGGLEAAQVAVLDLATGKYKVVVRGGSHAHYVPSGHLVYTAEGTLRAVPFDLTRLETRGTPVTVLPRLVTTQQGAGNFDVAADGTLAYVDAPGATSRRRARWCGWIAQGREEPLGAPPRPYFHPRVSPDGTRVAVAIEDQENDIWVWDLARQTLDRLTFGPAADFAPVWTPDGHRLVFFSQREGEGGLFWQAADGPGGAERLERRRPSVRRDAGWQAGALRHRREPGHDDAGARRHAPRATAAADAVHRAQRHRLTGRPLAGLRIGQLRAIRDLRRAVSQRERGAMADLDGRRHAAALGAEAARNCSMWRPMARSWPCASTLAAASGDRAARRRSSRGRT